MFDIIINYFNPPYVCKENGSVWDKVSGLCLYWPYETTARPASERKVKKKDISTIYKPFSEITVVSFRPGVIATNSEIPENSILVKKDRNYGHKVEGKLFAPPGNKFHYNQYEMKNHNVQYQCETKVMVLAPVKNAKDVNQGILYENNELKYGFKRDGKWTISGAWYYDHNRRGLPKGHFEFSKVPPNYGILQSRHTQTNCSPEKYTRCIHGICFQAETQGELDAQIGKYMAFQSCRNSAADFKQTKPMPYPTHKRSKWEDLDKIAEDYLSEAKIESEYKNNLRRAYLANKDMDSYKKYKAFKAEIKLKKSEIKHAEEIRKLEIEYHLSKLNYPG